MASEVASNHRVRYRYLKYFAGHNVVVQPYEVDNLGGGGNLLIINDTQFIGFYQGDTGTFNVAILG